MIKSTFYARTGAAAIAAVLALSSTPTLAQEAQPVPTDPAPATTTEPVSTPDTSVTTDTSTTSTPDTTAATTTAKRPTRSATTARTTRTVRTAAVAKPAPAPAPSRVTHTTVATHSAAPAVAAAPAAALAPAKPAPVVDLSAKPAQPTPQPAKASSGMPNETAMEIGGGALALLALGGGAWALSRRRRRHEEEEWYGEESYDQGAIEHHEEPVAEHEPMPQHDVVDDGRTYAEPAHISHEPEVMGAAAGGASAFAWGNEQRGEQQADDDGSDRRPGETWVERAYRGPSPANPSASLRTRLKRAAFFDKRERDVAEGKAEPVETDAGLPEAATEEFESA